MNDSLWSGPVGSLLKALSAWAIALTVMTYTPNNPGEWDWWGAMAFLGASTVVWALLFKELER